MPCDALVCRREASCANLDCCGHPKGAAAYLEELDRQSLAHHAAMSCKLQPAEAGNYWPREQAVAGTVPPLDPRIERWLLRVLLVAALASALIFGPDLWAAFQTWRNT